MLQIQCRSLQMAREARGFDDDGVTEWEMQENNLRTTVSQMYCNPSKMVLFY